MVMNLYGPFIKLAFAFIVEALAYGDANGINW